MVRSVLLVAAVALGLGGCNTAYNYFEDEPDPAMEGRDMTLTGSLLTMTGIAPKPRSAIEYNPRAPLAIPGTTELPSPDTASDAQSAVNFPVDHDETERQRRLAAVERGQAAAYETEYTRGTTGRVSPDEVVAGRRAGGGLARLPEKVIPDNENQTNFHLSREEMRQKIPTGEKLGLVLEEGGTAAPRRFLIQPPEAYRTPVASAPLPEEGDIENSEWIKKRLYDKDLERRPERLIPQQ